MLRSSRLWYNLYLLSEFGDVRFVAAFFFLVQYVSDVITVSKHNLILTLVIAVLVLAQFAAQMVYFGIDIKPTQYGNMDKLLPITRATNSLIAIADCTIAGALVWLFRSSRTGFQHTDKVLSRLVVFVVSTGLVTAMSAVLALILSLAYPSDYYYVFFHLNIVRCECSFTHLAFEVTEAL